MLGLDAKLDFGLYTMRALSFYTVTGGMETCVSFTPTGLTGPTQRAGVLHIQSMVG